MAFSTRFLFLQSSRWQTSGSEKGGVRVGGPGEVGVEVRPVVRLMFMLSYPEGM